MRTPVAALAAVALTLASYTGTVHAVSPIFTPSYTGNVVNDFPAGTPGVFINTNTFLPASGNWLDALGNSHPSGWYWYDVRYSYDWVKDIAYFGESSLRGGREIQWL